VAPPDAGDGRFRLERRAQFASRQPKIRISFQLACGLPKRYNDAP
jgi:hypothetical protein